jgi:hypothetical protein
MQGGTLIATVPRVDCTKVQKRNFSFALKHMDKCIEQHLAGVAKPEHHQMVNQLSVSIAPAYQDVGHQSHRITDPYDLCTGCGLHTTVPGHQEIWKPSWILNIGLFHFARL